MNSDLQDLNARYNEQQLKNTDFSQNQKNQHHQVDGRKGRIGCLVILIIAVLALVASAITFFRYYGSGEEPVITGAVYLEYFFAEVLYVL